MITLEIGFGVFVGLGVFAGIVVLGVAGGLTIRNKLRNVSRQLFGTESIVDGLSKQADNQTAQIKEVYNNIKIHQTEISNYRKDKGNCIIVIQSAVEYYHYKVSGDHVTEGSKERKVQTKYNVELLYVQDGEEKEFDNAFTTTCPQCGAPVRGLGNMICEYCGAHVVPINTKVWSLHKLYQVDYNHV